MRGLTIEELRKVQLQILDDVTAFCDANGITYFLCGGTLLGAIRHKGYIPWDDDIDLMMPRPDYQKFIQAYNQSGKRYRCSFFPVAVHFVNPFAKVFDTTTKLVEKNSHDIDMGVNIDIFPIDGMPDSVQKATNLIDKIGVYRKFFDIKRMDFRKGRAIKKELVRVLGKICAFWIPIDRLTRKIIKLACSCKYDSASFAGILVWGYGLRERCDKRVYRETVPVTFEGKTYCAPVGYDEYLTNVYGDYMQLPPENKRVTHHDFAAFGED